MNAMRDSWTDERLDDLSQRVSDGFRDSRQDQRSSRDEIKAELTTTRSEVKAELATVRSEINRRFDRVDIRFDALEARFDAMQRLLIATLLTIVLSLVLDRL